MPQINFLYEFMTPNGYLPLGYQQKDLPIIFSETNDRLDIKPNVSTRMVRDDNVFVSNSTEDMFNVLSEPINDCSHRVLMQDISVEQLRDDYNILVITTVHEQGITKYIKSIDLDDLFSKKTLSIFKQYDSVRLVFIDEKEGAYIYEDEFFKKFQSFANKHNLKENKIVFITNTSNIKQIYQDFLNRNNVSSFMICDTINFCIDDNPGQNILRYEGTTNNYEINSIVERGTEYSIDPRPTIGGTRKKHFLCLNRNSSRFHRPKLVLDLIGSDVFDKGLVSLFRTPEFDKFCEQEQNVLYKLLIKEKYPFVIDYDDPDYVADMHNYFTKRDMWNDTYFSLVTETDVKNGPVFITEKTIRPMIYFHPFIVYGNPNTLAELHKMGFETFPEIFDESYDTIEDENERLSSIMRSVTKLCSLPLEDLHKLYFSVYPKLVHNRNLLVEFTKTQRLRNKFLHLISL